MEDKVGEQEDFVISKDEIYTFLTEVRNKSRISLLGVENIVLTSRPKQLFKVFSGAYRPYQSYRSNEGATIFLYPFEKEDDLYRYYFGYKDKRNNEDVNDLDNDHYEEYYLLISKEQAKKEQLFTLGHELGHSTIYNLKEQLHGIDIEYFCDQFSKDLGGKTIQQDKETFLHSDIYKNGKKLGLVKDVLDENILKQLIS